MTSTSSNPSLWTFNFCYDSRAHPGCIQQAAPKHIRGIKPKNSVGRLLGKFCKKSKLNSEDLEIHKCLCYEPKNDAHQDTLLDLPMKLSSSRKGLTNGGFLFVRRVERMEVEEEEEEESEDEREGGSGSDASLETSKRSSLSLNHSSKDSSVRTKIKKDRDTPSQIALYREQTIKLLGGDAFLSQRSFNLPFIGASGFMYWQLTSIAVRVALRMTPQSERREAGCFPSILIRAVNHCSKERERRSRKPTTQVARSAFKDAIELMRSQAVLGMGKNDPLFCHPDELEELTVAHHPQLHSLAARISKLWGNTSWKRQRLRLDLGPITLRGVHLLKALCQLAELTAVKDEKNSSNVGFPPLVLRALREALVRDEALVSKGELRHFKSSSSWPQERVVKAALPILQGYLESNESSAQIASSSQVESNSSSLQPHTSISQPSIQSQLADLKTNKKRKLLESLTEEEKRKVKKQYKKAKKLLKRE